LAQQYRILYVCGEESSQQVSFSLGVVDAPDKNPLAPSTAGATASREPTAEKVLVLTLYGSRRDFES